MKKSSFMPTFLHFDDNLEISLVSKVALIHFFLLEQNTQSQEFFAH